MTEEKAAEREVFEPGVYYDLPADRYHAAEGHGSTTIRKGAATSVAHALADLGEESPALRRGSLDHTTILEPEIFDRDFVVAEIIDCRGTTAKGTPCSRRSLPGSRFCAQHEKTAGVAEADDFVAAVEAEGKKIVTSEELERAREVNKGVRAAIARTSLGWVLGDNVAHEVSFFAFAVVDDDPAGPGYYITTEPPEGARVVRVKGRTDIKAPRLILDLKGTSKPGGLLPRKWQWQIEDFGLHIQAALYTDLAEAVTGERDTQFGWLVHEVKKPFGLRAFRASERDLDAGRRAVGEGVRRWAHYYETGDPWLGWPTEIEEVGRPAFVQRIEEES